MKDSASEGCPICKSMDVNNELPDLYDDRFGYPGKFQLLKCSNCNHQFLDGDFPSELLRDLYSNYYPRTNFKIDDFRPYQEAHGFKSWLNGDKSSPFRWVQKNVRVLDIGCGFGESLGYHQQRGCDVYGVEADENIRRVSEKYGFKVHVGLFDSQVYHEDFFDNITLSQVIEHVTDPGNVLTGVARILKSTGHVILSTPNAHGLGRRVFGRSWIHWHTPYHLHFFSNQSLKLASQKAGLRIEAIKTITPSMWSYLQLVHLLSYPSERVASTFWLGHNFKPQGWRRAAYKIINGLYKLKLFHLYTRVLDLLRLGDNLVIVMRKI